MSCFDEKGPNKTVYYFSMCGMAFSALLMWRFKDSCNLLPLYRGFALWLVLFCLMFMNRPRKKKY